MPDKPQTSCLAETKPEQQAADSIVAQAAMAAAVFNQLDQAATDRIVEHVFRACFANRVKLAKMACEETGLGIWQDKVLKNVLASQFVYENIRSERTVGVISHNPVSGITEIAQPLGPIFAIIPVTNPTSTVIFKALIALKTRNPVIFSPSRKAMECSRAAAKICYDAALEADAPEDCIQCLPEASRTLTQAVMSHPGVALILATGGTGLVRAAYSSGTPAIGVGPGNVPVFIDKSADIPFAVQSLLISKTFDNGTVCASEQAVVVEAEIAAEVKKEFEAQGGYFLSEEEARKVEAIAIDPGSKGMNPAVVGQPVQVIAAKAGITVPAGTRILLAPLDGVGEDVPLSGEVLAPILGFYQCGSFDEAIKTCIDLNYRGGIGHTASIYANDQQVIEHFSEMMNAGRVVVNTPSSQGAVGGLFNALETSLTLGCGAGGKNITTENITARHLINIKRICRRRKNQRWFDFATEQFFDESRDIDSILGEYNKNY